MSLEFEWIYRENDRGFFRLLGSEGHRLVPAPESRMLAP